MIKNIAIVSLSSGVLGEGFISHELEIGLKRLEAYGLTVQMMPHALKGIEYVKNNPEHRAADLLQALRDPGIDMILCAIGGDDTYRLLPYLFEDKALDKAISNKVFLGFSDTTINHFMLHKAGLNTFYGQCFLSDICELAHEMLPYTKRYFEELIMTGRIAEIVPSDVWYESRSAFGPEQIGVSMPAHPDRGFELLQGSPVFSGAILGGCIDSLYDFFDGERYADMPVLCEKYGLFPSLDDWRGKILMLETSEEKMPPDKFRKALEYLKMTGLFEVISGIILGKPDDDVYHDEYKEVLKTVIANPSLPILCNVNIGHASPRCIMPFGVRAVVDAQKQSIKFDC